MSFPRTGRAVDAATFYASRGLPVLPVQGDKKPHFNALGVSVGAHRRATTDASTITRWFTDYPDAGIAIMLQNLDITVLDVDPRNGGLRTLEELQMRGDGIPMTVTATTHSGGTHHWYQGRAPVTTLGPGVDVKTSGYVIAPRTRLPGGHAYEWVRGLELGATSLTPLPEWILGLQPQQKPYIMIGSEMTIPVGQRHEYLWRRAAALRGQGLGEAAIALALRDLADRDCDQPPDDRIEDDELEGLARWAARFPPGRPSRARIGGDTV